MTSSQSIEVLNDAHDFQRRLDWVLFCEENEWPYIEGAWNPGEPLFERPCQSECCYNEVQWIRAIVELHDAHTFHTPDGMDEIVLRCTDCEGDLAIAIEHYDEAGRDLEIAALRGREDIGRIESGYNGCI